MRRLYLLTILIAALATPVLAQVRVGAAGGRPMGPVRIGPVGPSAAPRMMAPSTTFRGPIIRRSGPTFGTFGNKFVFNPACDPFVFQCSPPFISVFNGFHRFRFRRFGRFGSFGFSPFGFSSFGVSPVVGYPIFADYQEPVVQQPAAATPPVIIYAQPPADQYAERAPTPAPEPQAAPARASEPEPAEPVILIFRDHTREEVSNYAIAGDTLYVLLPHGRRKIPLSDLDVPATIKANDARGVDFRVPAQKGS